MKPTKKCLQCGSMFVGRTNKIYCCEKCKMAAFQERETATVSGLESIATTLPHGNYLSRKASNMSEESLKLLVKLRKQELDYAKQMKQMEITDKEQQRNHELLKLELLIARNKQQQQALIDLEANGGSLPSAPMKALPSASNNREEDQADIHEYQELDKEEFNNDSAEEETLVPLADKLRKTYCAIVQDYLDGEGAEWDKAALKEVMDGVATWLKKVTIWAEKQDVSPDAYEETVILAGIQENCQEYIKKLNRRGWLESKFIQVKLAKDWQTELRNSLK